MANQYSRQKELGKLSVIVEQQQDKGTPILQIRSIVRTYLFVRGFSYNTRKDYLAWFDTVFIKQE